MQKWMSNCGIEKGLYNPDSFSTTREKHHLDGWRCTKSDNLVWLSLTDKYFVLFRVYVVWYSKQRPPDRLETEEDFLVQFWLWKEERKLQKVFTARSDTIFTNFIDSIFSISTRTKQASQTKVNKIKPFSLLSVKETLWVICIQYV